jgi:hypothetical protein
VISEGNKPIIDRELQPVANGLNIRCLMEFDIWVDTFWTLCLNLWTKLGHPEMRKPLILLVPEPGIEPGRL